MGEISLEVLVVLPLIMFCQLACSYLESRFPQLMLHLPEVGVVILIGMFTGWLISTNPDSSLESLESFSPPLFFIGLLPPIIFNSGFHLKRSLFFCNVTPILSFAVAGTIASAALIGVGMWLLTEYANPLSSIENPLTLAECLTFGALISATDPVSTLVLFAELRVEPHLFYLVFGESVLNDAVGIVLFSTAREFIEGTSSASTIYEACGRFVLNLVGSTLVGLVLPVVLAAVIRHSEINHNPTLEQGLVVLFLWMPYLVGESMELSGIVATLAAGMASRKFIVPNLNEGSEGAVVGIMRLLSGFMETAAFLNLGMVAVLHGYESYDTGMIFWAIVLCSVSRPLQVYGLSWLLNRDCAKSLVPTKTPTKTQHMLSFSGLRGVVAFALAMQWPDDDDHDDPARSGHKKLFKATTSMVILFTVFVQGTGTYSMLKWLDIEVGCDEKDIAIPEEPTFVKVACQIIDRFLTPLAFGFLPCRRSQKKGSSFASKDSDRDDIIRGNLLSAGGSFDGESSAAAPAFEDEDTKPRPTFEDRLTDQMDGDGAIIQPRRGSTGGFAPSITSEYDEEDIQTRPSSLSAPMRRSSAHGGYYDTTEYRPRAASTTNNAWLDSYLDELRTREHETSIYDFAPPRHLHSTNDGASTTSATSGLSPGMHVGYHSRSFGGNSHLRSQNLSSSFAGYRPPFEPGASIAEGDRTRRRSLHY